MNILDDTDPLKRNPGTQCPGSPDPEAPGQSRYAAGNAATTGGSMLNEGKTQRWKCTSCMYYDPERTYCTYIHAPVNILFTCPQVLDRRR